MNIVEMNKLRDLIGLGEMEKAFDFISQAIKKQMDTPLSKAETEIINLLDKEKSTKQIIKESSFSLGTVETALFNLVDKGFIEKVTRGIYRKKPKRVETKGKNQLLKLLANRNCTKNEIYAILDITKPSVDFLLNYLVNGLEIRVTGKDKYGVLPAFYKVVEMQVRKGIKSRTQIAVITGVPISQVQCAMEYLSRMDRRSRDV